MPIIVDEDVMCFEISMGERGPVILLLYFPCKSQCLLVFSSRFKPMSQSWIEKDGCIIPSSQKMDPLCDQELV